MSNEADGPPQADVPALATAIYTILERVDSHTRHLAMDGAFAMLGETAKSVTKHIEEPITGDADNEFPRKAQLWMKQYGVTREHLADVFQGAELIAMNLPGSYNTDNTENVY